MHRPVFAIAAGLFLIGHAEAAVVAAVGEPTGATRTDPYPDAGYGFYLPVGATYTVNQLGFWDQGGDGLVQSHEVTLYQYNGFGSNYTVIATATIGAGTGNLLDGGFRWAGISDLVLTENGQGGNYYVIMASQGGDTWTDNGVAPMDPTFGTVGSRALNFTGANTVGSTGDIIGGGTPVYGGANFGFTAVPEPSTAAITGLALLGAACLRTRRRA